MPQVAAGLGGVYILKRHPKRLREVCKVNFIRTRPGSAKGSKLR